MPVKAKSRTFKPGDRCVDVMRFIDEQLPSVMLGSNLNAKIKKRIVITITYERDDKTE